MGSRRRGSESARAIVRERRPFRIPTDHTRGIPEARLSEPGGNLGLRQCLRRCLRTSDRRATLRVMSSYVVGYLIGGGFVLAGALLAALRDDHARNAERQARQAERLEAAMREYLAALYAIAAETSDTPEQPKQSSIDRWLDSVARKTSFDIVLHIVIRLLRRAAYGRRHDELGDRMIAAATQLRLVAPGSVLAIMREIEQVTEQVGQSGPGWNREWRAMRDRVRTSFRNELAAVEAPRRSRLFRLPGGR